MSNPPNKKMILLGVLTWTVLIMAGLAYMGGFADGCTRREHA
jgi:hypothetical protein